MMRSLILFVYVLVGVVAAFADIPETASELGGRTQVVVTALDLQRHPMRSGLGLVWDEQTLICSYRLVSGAALVQTQAAEATIQTSRVVSYSRYFDLTVLQTTEDLPLNNPLGSSDTIGKGDALFVLIAEKDHWVSKSLSVKSWDDPGKGYQLILTDPPPGRFEPSPVYNRDGKVVGWMFAPGKTIPVRDLDRFVTGKSGTVSLAELNSAVTLWEPKQLPAGSASAQVLSSLELRMVRGTVHFPFQVSFPKNWKVQVEVRESHFVVRTWEESMGICMELRIIPQQSEDLPAAIEKAETLMFSGMSRCDFSPYSAKHISGFLACYENPDPAMEDGISAFYGMMGMNLYVLTITYPEKWEEEVRPFREKTLDSLQL